MKARDREDLLKVLQQRFQANMSRHMGITWSQVLDRIDANPTALKSLQAMETTGGEPDVIGKDPRMLNVLFCDCSAESPLGRRNLCYDRQALDARKQNKPSGCVIEMTESIGIELLTEDRYRCLQELGEFDRKTSSWIQTPPDIRTLGGALFCDRRFGKVFVYHNGAESYYGARGFRGLLRI